MITLPNFISLLRLPLAFLFLQENILYRAVALLLAMGTDALDGFIARRYKQTSKLGLVLDPVMDKFFVVFLLTVFLQEKRLETWQAATFFCRDLVVLFFGLYMVMSKQLMSYTFKPFWFGKISTALQFAFLFALTAGLTIPAFVYGLFGVLGFAASLELFYPALVIVNKKNRVD